LQGLWDDVSPLSMLPYMDNHVLGSLARQRISTIKELLRVSPDSLRAILSKLLAPAEVARFIQVTCRLISFLEALEVKNDDSLGFIYRN
jgi:hypothetical protein